MTPAESSKAESWLDSSAQKEAEELLRRRFTELKYWNIEDAIGASMSLDGTRSRFLYLQTVLPESAFTSGARVFVSGTEAGGEMIIAREFGFGPVHGVDVDPYFVEVAQRRVAGLEGFDCRLYDGTRIPFEDGLFDVVLSGHVIEHTADPCGYLRELFRVLRNGGYLFLEYPTRFHTKELHTGLPSLEWAPGPFRRAALRFLGSKLAPLEPETRRKFFTILDTGLKPISLPQIRYWIARSPSRATLLDATRAAPGIIRTVFRKDGRRDSGSADAASPGDRLTHKRP
ncbi:MAG: class I SAM-dependent methyltransferase [Thermoanaerobaculia bacterium]